VHPFVELSAYIDDALDSSAKAAVGTHLGSCAVCRTRLAELRDTARLIAALPAPVPSRSLVPRVSAPFWLAPMRTLATLASGAALFLFVASAVMSALPLGTGGGAAAPALAPAPNDQSHRIRFARRGLRRKREPDAGAGAGGAALPSDRRDKGGHRHRCPSRAARRERHDQPGGRGVQRSGASAARPVAVDLARARGRLRRARVRATAEAPRALTAILVT